MRRRVLAAAFVVGLVVGAIPTLLITANAGPNVDPYRGLGAWVDVFDYVPAFRGAGPPAVSVETIEDLAVLGAETVYLQAAIDDERSKGLLADRKLVGQILERAHDVGMRVVAWYYPQLVTPARDLHRVEALADFRWRGHRFDSIALDIESRLVPDVTERNARLVQLAQETRRLSGERSVGAIVYPAVQMEVVNPNLWPNFPYVELAPHIDVWLPMAYWTYREAPYHDAYVYTEESVTRLRANLGDEGAAVHPIGGLGELSTPEDYVKLVQAAQAVAALGWSIYDADTTKTTGWAHLQEPG